LGNINKYDSETMREFIESFFNVNNAKFISRFTHEMRDLTECESVTKAEVEKICQNLPIDINIKAMLIMLMRNSESLLKIKGSAIQGLIDEIQREEKARRNEANK
jgi:hypothetical protein